MSARFLPCLLLGLLACRDARQSVLRSRPPAAEFILAAGDSAYWVTSDSSGIRVRGAPIELARLGDEFYEMYVVDDDRSYEGADLIGQGVYRRDLRTGDSVRVFTDSIVPALARRYAATHPGERRLTPDEEGDPQPELRATATLEFSGTHGPFVSYILHTDVERAEHPFWHVSRAGVFDLRNGHVASVADVAGPDAPMLVHRHDEMVARVLDSVRARAPRLLGRYQPDPTSFTLTTANSAPAIEFSLPISGTDDVDHALDLPPVPFAEPAWWNAIAPGLPASSGDGAQDSWQHAGYTVLARYDSASEGRIVLKDRTSHEWIIARISAPASRIYWLDRQSFDTQTRHALVRAFEEAATYGSETHVASRRSAPVLQLTMSSQ